MVTPAIEALLLIQDRDLSCRQVRKQLDSLPQEEAQVRAEMAAIQAQLDAEAAQVAELEKQQRAQAAQIEDAENRIVKYKTQQMQVKKNEEYTALEHEISGLQNQIDAAETAELEVLEAIDLAKARLAEATAAAQRELQTHTHALKRLSDKQTNLASELVEADKALKKAVEAAGPEAVQRYQQVTRIIRRPPYIVPVNEGKCCGCHLRISNETNSQVLRGDSIVHCDNCNRIVYLDR